mmetsp:Transcript_22489/g.32326  ORF Transcript_22489/g.32326 Transcript_22489/m.32326 type:complete len:181 (+) Transcript_22489:175-717(+)
MLGVLFNSLPESMCLNLEQCGLTGILISSIPGVESVTFTDHDPGCLQLLRDNISLNNQTNAVYHAQTFVSFYSWGDATIPVDSSLLVESLEPKIAPTKFHLIIGSDLIYCIEVVQPLFQTIKNFLITDNGLFILATSFSLGERIDEEVEKVCRDLNIRKESVTTLNEKENICRIDYFRNN